MRKLHSGSVDESAMQVTCTALVFGQISQVNNGLAKSTNTYIQAKQFHLSISFVSQVQHIFKTDTALYAFWLLYGQGLAEVVGQRILT